MEENTNMENQPEETPSLEDKPAALTLVIQSWATPIVGIIMLVAGLFGGYYLRPVLSPTSTSVAVAERASSVTGDAPSTIPTPDAERAAQQQELMTAVVEGTRHFRGDPNAPVTIIEFSDFQ